MYRTSELQDIRLQKIISKEIMNAFDELFDVKSNDPALIKENIQHFCEDMDINVGSNLELGLLCYKITGMYAELADDDHQYTFDEHGEWLLAKLLIYMLNSYEAFLQYAEEESDEFKDRMPSIEDFWETSLTDEDIAYVTECAEDYFSGTVNEIFEDDEDPEEYQEWMYFQKEMFIQRVIYFPMMAFEITDEMTPEFLFWDRDFMLIDQFGKEAFEQMRDNMDKSGNPLGFMGVSENTQMYTGSEKFELDICD